MTESIMIEKKKYTDNDVLGILDVLRSYLNNDEPFSCYNMIVKYQEQFVRSRDGTN